MSISCESLADDQNNQETEHTNNKTQEVALVNNTADTFKKDLL